MKKRYFFSIVGALAAVSLSIGAIVIAKNASLKELKKAEGDVYTLNLNADNAPAGLTDSYAVLTANAITAAPYSNPIELKFVNAKAAADSYVQLANHGLVYNFNSANGLINGIQGITVTFTAGDVKLRMSPAPLDNGGVHLNVEEQLTSGVEYVPGCPAKYFSLEAGDAGATIKSIQIKYSCDVNDFNLKAFNGTYTGKGSDGSTYKMVATDGSATIDSLDKYENLHLTGTYTWLDAAQLKIRCTFVYNSYNIYYDLQASLDLSGFTFVAKSDDYGGAVAGNVAEISTLKKVYEIENFEEYAVVDNGYEGQEQPVVDSGIGVDTYDGGHTADQIKGARSGFYGQYKNSSYVFTHLPVADYMAFTTTGGRNGSKAAAFKADTATEVRYFQSKTLAGVNNIVAKAKYLSVWVKTFKDAKLQDTKTAGTTVKLLAYGTKSFSDTNKTTKDFTVPGDGQWHQIVMELTNTPRLYLFGIYMNKQSGYVMLDDVEVYTDNPHASYTKISSVSLDYHEANVELGKEFRFVTTIAPSNASNPAVTWTSSDPSVATVANGVVTPVALGTTTITVKANENAAKTDTCEVTVINPQTYFSGLYVGNANLTVLEQTGDWPIAVAAGDQGQIEYLFCGINVGVVKYLSDGSTFSIISNKTVNVQIDKTTTIQVYAGTISGDIGSGKLENVSVTGAKVNGSAITPNNNGSIEMAKRDSSNSLFNNCDGTTSELQAAFGRRYDTGSGWVKDNPARIEASTAYKADGTGSLKFRGYSDGKAALTLASDLPESLRKAFNNVSFWVYNSTDKVIKNVNLFIYRAENFGSYAQIGGYTLQPHTWTFISCGFKLGEAESLYNMQVYTEKIPTEALYFDNFCLYNA